MSENDSTADFRLERIVRPQIDLGDGHLLIFQSGEGDIAGCIIEHKRKDGTPCKGWIPFAGRSWAQTFQGKIAAWDVVSDAPLTLSPSVLCRICGDHGFVRDDKWVRA